MAVIHNNPDAFDATTRAADRDESRFSDDRATSTRVCDNHRHHHHYLTCLLYLRRLRNLSRTVRVTGWCELCRLACRLIDFYGPLASVVPLGLQTCVALSALLCGDSAGILLKTLTL